MLLYVNKYADFEFRIYKFIIRIPIYCCYLHKLENKLLKFKINLEVSFQRVLLVNNFTLWKMVERDIYNILHGGKGEE